MGGGGSGLSLAQTPGMFMGKSAELLSKAEEWRWGGLGGVGGGGQDFSQPRHLGCSWVNQLSY